MKAKVILVVIILTTISIGSFYYYNHNYVSTLMLSEIVGKTDNAGINIAVKLFDFDTGLTRHEISQLNDRKDYWISRIKEVEAIQDTDQKTQASAQLLSEMMDDPVLKKICSGILNFGTDASFGLIEMIL